MPNERPNVLLRHIRRLVATRPLCHLPDKELLAQFIADRNEAAFALLVQRHGAMVLGVSRSLLRQRQDAEDVLQATFLVLARKAASIRKPEALASWLHGVARRLALKLRARSLQHPPEEN